jgi:hypothetical protein
VSLAHGLRTGGSGFFPWSSLPSLLTDILGQIFELHLPSLRKYSGVSVQQMRAIIYSLSIHSMPPVTLQVMLSRMGLPIHR